MTNKLPFVFFLAICSLFQEAHAQTTDVDPFIGVNRVIYGFNETLDGIVIKPVTLGYNAVMPGFAKRGVSNFFNNIDDINVVVNDLLQFKFSNALQDSGRLALNSTFGLVGFIDVAQRFGLYKNEEDFGQTLGYWGMDSGPYLLLPLLGSSDVRDALGSIPDMFFNPIFWINDHQTKVGIYSLATVDARLSYLSAEAMITGDKYTFVRDAYLQRRQYLVADGEVYDEFDDF